MAILLVVIIACGTVIFAMRKYGKKPAPAKKPSQKQDIDFEYTNLPFKISKSVQTTMAFRTRYPRRCNKTSL
jgi:hypothetical protein